MFIFKTESWQYDAEAWYLRSRIFPWPLGERVGDKRPGGAWHRTTECRRRRRRLRDGLWRWHRMLADTLSRQADTRWHCNMQHTGARNSINDDTVRSNADEPKQFCGYKAPALFSGIAVLLHWDDWQSEVACFVPTCRRSPNKTVLLKSYVSPSTHAAGTVQMSGRWLAGGRRVRTWLLVRVAVMCSGAVEDGVADFRVGDRSLIVPWGSRWRE